MLRNAYLLYLDMCKENFKTGEKVSYIMNFTEFIKLYIFFTGLMEGEQNGSKAV